MKKDDFWFISLIALFVIGVCTEWNFWIALAVIANSVLILFQVGCRILSAVKRRQAHGKQG